MDEKKSEELLAEIYRNCQLALTSIADILPAVDDESLKAEILREHEEYEKISGDAAVIAKNRGYEVKEPNPMKKAMMWGSIKLNTLKDDSTAHIAEMMIQGTVMGITSLKTSLGDANKEDEIAELCKTLIDKEEEFESVLKGFLN